MDDELTTLLDQQQGGIHAGGSVRLGERPLLSASGGLTLNPPDLHAVREGLQTLAETVREAAGDPAAAAQAAGEAVRSAIPDLGAALPQAMETLGAAVPAIAHAGSRLDAAELVRRGRRVLGLTPSPRTRDRLLALAPGLGMLVAAGGMVAVAWLWHPEHGAARRRRLVALVRERIAGRSDAAASPIGTGGRRDLVAIPVEPEETAERPSGLAAEPAGV
jgi:hypothetical protein